MLVFVADHISIPADARRMDLTDKERYERIRETMGEYCAIVELARVEESEAVRWIEEYGHARGVKIDPDAARELVDSLGGDMMMISNELEKLILYVGEKKRITLGRRRNHGAGGQAAVILRTDRRHFLRDRDRALEVLDAILSTGDGDEAAIGHLYMLAKTFRQMLVILERNVRDQRDAVGGAVAGLSRSSVCGRRHHSAGAPLQIESRELTRAIRLVARPIWRCARTRRASGWCWKNSCSISLPSPSRNAGWMQEELPI